MAAAVVHMKENDIRLNDSASVLNAEMTAIRVVRENASETRYIITIHTDSLTAVNIQNNRKLDLNIITRAIRDAVSRLTQRLTINCIPAHTGIPGNENADQAGKRGLQLDRIRTTVETEHEMSNILTRDNRTTTEMQGCDEDYNSITEHCPMEYW